MAVDLSFFARSNLPDCNGAPGCSTPPACPACGGLECLCRPRFFAGQLLTEDDLNRLDHYIVAKNRLHNRYLIGWGVACGLEVVCNVCGPDQAAGGVLVGRDFPPYEQTHCRISLGTMEEMQKAVEVFRRALTGARTTTAGARPQF